MRQVIFSFLLIPHVLLNIAFYLFSHLYPAVPGMWAPVWCQCYVGWRGGWGAQGPVTGRAPCGDTPGTAGCQTPGWSSWDWTWSLLCPVGLIPGQWSGPQQSHGHSPASLTRLCFSPSGCIVSQWSSEIMLHLFIFHSILDWIVCILSVINLTIDKRAFFTPVSFMCRIWAASSLSTSGRNQMGCDLMSLSRLVTGSWDPESELLLVSDRSRRIPLSRRQVWKQEWSFGYPEYAVNNYDDKKWK